MELTVNNATEAFELLHSNILAVGSPTNAGTIALYNVLVHIVYPEDRIIKTEWRHFNPKYAEREWQWYLKGNPDVTELEKYAPLWKKMHSGNGLVQSNYGWQWNRNNQLNKCIEQLKHNKSTRQAWVTIYDGKEKDNYKYDAPCTISVGFDFTPNTDTLNMTVIMRSNDVIYGFCNDQYCFSKLHEMVAYILGASIGTYTHFAHDMHIYKEQLNMHK